MRNGSRCLPWFAFRCIVAGLGVVMPTAPSGQCARPLRRKEAPRVDANLATDDAGGPRHDRSTRTGTAGSFGAGSQTARRLLMSSTLSSGSAAMPAPGRSGGSASSALRLNRACTSSPCAFGSVMPLAGDVTAWCALGGAPYMPMRVDTGSGTSSTRVNTKKHATTTATATVVSTARLRGWGRPRRISEVIAT
jgi:hypothetical protein